MPENIRSMPNAEAQALADQLARLTAQIAEFEAHPKGHSALLAALRKRRDELKARLGRVRPMLSYVSEP
jgi:hypothetical protein